MGDPQEEEVLEEEVEWEVLYGAMIGGGGRKAPVWQSRYVPIMQIAISQRAGVMAAPAQGEIGQIATPTIGGGPFAGRLKFTGI